MWWEKQLCQIHLCVRGWDETAGDSTVRCLQAASVEPLWSVDHARASSTVLPLTSLWNRQSTVKPKPMEVSLALHCEKEHYCDGFSPDMSLVSMQRQWRLCAPQHLDHVDQTSIKSLVARGWKGMPQMWVRSSMPWWISTKIHLTWRLCPLLWSTL